MWVDYDDKISTFYRCMRELQTKFLGSTKNSANLIPPTPPRDNHVSNQAGLAQFATIQRLWAETKVR